MKSIFISFCTAAVLLVWLSGCGSLKPELAAAPKFYTLDFPQAAVTPAAADNLPTLLVSPSSAASGFDSQHIIYTRVEHQLEYFAQSEWIDTPSRMVGPLMITALAGSGAFHAVVPATGSASAALRLTTQIVRLQHEFTTQPGQVRFTLRAYLIDNVTRTVLAYREFDEVVVPPSDSPQDGIAATNLAVQKGLQELSLFCAGAARDWQAGQVGVSSAVK